MQNSDELDASSLEDTQKLNSLMSAIKQREQNNKLTIAALEKEIQSLQAQLTEAKGIIAQKDHFIEDSVKQFNAVVAQLGHTIHLVQDDASIPTKNKFKMQICLTDAKLMSPKRLEAIIMFGDYLEKNPKYELPMEEWGPNEFAEECIKELIRAYEGNHLSITSTSDCLKPMYAGLKDAVAKQQLKLTREFENLLLAVQSLQLDDTARVLNAEDKKTLSKLLQQLFGPEGYDISSVFDYSSKIALNKEYSSGPGMF